MSTYASHKRYKTDGGERLITVQSSRCVYDVWLSREQINLNGPGVDETADNEFEQYQSSEDLAIHIVLMFENGLWP